MLHKLDIVSDVICVMKLVFSETTKYVNKLLNGMNSQQSSIYRSRPKSDLCSFKKSLTACMFYVLKMFYLETFLVSG